MTALNEAIKNRWTNTDSINLKDILDGKLTKLPFELESDESLEFVTALADALFTIQQEEFPDVDIEDANCHLPAKFAVITDNFISFMMNEDNAFSAEIVIAAFIRAIRIHRVSFHSDTDAFTAFYRKYSSWIVNTGTDYKGVYVGDGQYDKDWKPTVPKTKNLVDGSGGYFTLRDHNMPKKNQ